MDTVSPQISLSERTMPCPAVTATCRPRPWMQQLTEGQTAEPRRERGSSNESLEIMEEIMERYLMNWDVNGEFYIHLIFLE